MKNFFLILLLFFSTPLLANTSSGLIIVINKLIPNVGCLNLAMYNNSVAYNSENINQAYLVLKQKVDDRKLEIFIPNLTFGTYGIQSFQDKDCTGRMKKGWFGIPKYAYGFSNNTRSRKFSKAKFEYNQKHKNQTIDLEEFSIL